MPVLTQAQLDSFRLNGFLHIPQLIPANELHAVRADSKALIERGIDGPIGDPTYCYGRDATDANRECLFRINDLINHHGHESFKLLLAYPPLLNAISEAVDHDSFVSSVHSLVFKIPHRGYPVPWHQDPVKVCRFPVFNVDVYLDEANPDNGGLYVIPGSHLAGYHGSPEFIRNWTGGKEHDAPGAIPVLAKPGDVIFHATSVVHGSFWNRSNSMRRTIYFHIDHYKDIMLQPDAGFPRASYMSSQRTTLEAIAARKAKYPQEKGFDYKPITEAMFVEGRKK